MVTIYINTVMVVDMYKYDVADRISILNVNIALYCGRDVKM